MANNNNSNAAEGRRDSLEPPPTLPPQAEMDTCARSRFESPIFTLSGGGGVGDVEKVPMSMPKEMQINGKETAIGIHVSESTPSFVGNGDVTLSHSHTSRESLIPAGGRERWYTILLQVFGPFMIAGFGMVAAGLLLHKVKDWKVFKEIPEFLVLVTPLLGLKGNLEMTLASRLSTHANLGHFDTTHLQLHIAFGNLALTQVQAVVVGFLASCVAILMGVVFEQRFVLSDALLLCATSVLTAAIASCILGLLMVIVILAARKLKINPDNVATPIAASLGDLITLFLLAWLASALYEEIDDKYWLAPSITLGYFLFLPVWIWIAYENEYTRRILRTGWPPVLLAMLISSGGGLLLDMAEGSFPKLALYQPVINGVGGNLVSVQASRISTTLHRDCEVGQLPGPRKWKDASTKDQAKGQAQGSPIWMSPWSVFFKQGVNSVAARVLLVIVIPGHLTFTTITHFVSGGGDHFSAVFLLIYLTAAVLQVVTLLYIAHNMINWFWTKKIDPDTSAIPFLTALGDLLGSGLLYAVFLIMSKISV